MFGSVTRRLHLVLSQPGTPAPVAAPEAPELPELEFVAYAEESRLSGRIRMDGRRLSDMLNDYEELVLEDVLIEGLPGGGETLVPEFLVRRSELLLVHATGPRGNPELRTRTIARALTLKSGPYMATGDVHSGPGIDPLLFFRRRRAMVPMTNASIQYRNASGPVCEYVDVVAVNRDLIDWVRVAEPGAVARDQAEIQFDRMGRPTN